MNMYFFVPMHEQLDTLRPVIVFIHGGGFSMGASASALYGPDYLMEENIVLVTIQYRLGALGKNINSGSY